MLYFLKMLTRWTACIGGLIIVICWIDSYHHSCTFVIQRPSSGVVVEHLSGIVTVRLEVVPDVRWAPELRFRRDPILVGSEINLDSFDGYAMGFGYAINRSDSIDPTRTWRSLALPYWFPLLVCVALGAFTLRKRGLRKHHCASCDYDLRGAVRSACPECGEPIREAIVMESDVGIRNE